MIGAQQWTWRMVPRAGFVDNMDTAFDALRALAHP
jgi:hypothetical protein